MTQKCGIRRHSGGAKLRFKPARNGRREIGVCLDLRHCWTGPRASSWMRDGGTLILAGHRSDLSKDFRIDEAASAGPGPIRPVPGSVYDAYGHELALPYVSQLTGSFTRWETILTRGTEPYALLNGDYDAVGGGRIIVFADDRLFSNLAMALALILLMLSLPPPRRAMLLRRTSCNSSPAQRAIPIMSRSQT